MEKYEIAKYVENFKKRINDIYEVLNVDDLKEEIKDYEQVMLKDEF